MREKLNIIHTLVTVIPKNGLEEFRVSISEIGGHKILNCRIWYKDQDGQMRPSKKGISVRTETARVILAAMEKTLTDGGF